MATSEKPAQIKLTAVEAQALKDRINSTNLTESDKKIISGLLSFNLWLEQQLHTAKLSIQRLKQLFGISTEKKTLK